MARLKLVFGIILAFIAIPIFLGGIAMVTALPLLQDSEGYYLSPSTRISESTGIGFIVNFDIQTDEEGDVEFDISNFATGKIWVRSDTPVFVAIGPTAEVEAYLSNQTYLILTDVQFEPSWAKSDDPKYEKELHTPEAGPVGQEPDWETSKTGKDVTLKWGLKTGSWSVFVRNADETAGFDVRYSVGAKVPILQAVGVVILVIGSFLLLISILLIVFDIRGHRAKKVPAWATKEIPPQALPSREVPREKTAQFFCTNCGAQYQEGDEFCTVCGDNLALADKTRFRSEAPYEEPHPQSDQLLIATGWSRFWAFLIDVVIIGVVIESLRLGLFWTSGSEEFFRSGGPSGFMWSLGPWGIASFIYWFLLEWRLGQSFGKMALGLEVVHMDSGKSPTDEEWLSVVISSIGKAFLFPIDLIVGWILQGKWTEETGVNLQQRLFQRAGRLAVVKKRIAPPSVQFTSQK